MPQTSTGAASTSILATCQVPAAGDFVTGAGLKAAIDPINNDLATIKSGTHTFAGDKTFSGDVHIAQTKALVADGSGVDVEGAWTIQDGASLSSNSDIVLNNYAAAQKSITGATNATPIVITTSANHGYVDGDLITVGSVGGNTAANGTWTIDVQSATTFALVGSAGSGAYTSGGTCHRLPQTSYGSARTTTRVLCATFDSGYAELGGVTRGWTTLSNGEALCFNSNPVSTSQYFGFYIDVPDGSVIVSATMYIQPNTGHGGAPANLPEVFINRIKLSNNSNSNLGSQTLGGTDPGYSAVTVTLGTPEIVNNRIYSYRLTLITETGANALENTHVMGATVTFTTRHVDQF